MEELTATGSEARALATDMAKAHAAMLHFYRNRCERTDAEAMTEDWLDPEKAVADSRERLLGAPAEMWSWNDLDRVGETDPETAIEAWQAVKVEARDELDSGHRAARVLEVVGGPWQRARFLALRASFQEQWQPRGGIEDSLIDAASQAYSQYEFWLGVLAERGGASAFQQKRQLEKYAQWWPPEQDAADATEQAGAMAERFHRMYLKTLRAMGDLRRYNGPVVVQNAKQVNVGGQQVNVVSESK